MADSPAHKKHAPSHPGALAGLPYPKLFQNPSDTRLPAELQAACDIDGTGSLGEAGDDEIDLAGKASKKDVPMWTVEEDLLILQLVERHGKRWSKIAQQLPGRTDNGVRNRWNRMERAQVLRQRRGPEAGYRCRRCGQPKRGHICAALTLGETPAGEELQQKAQALSKLSADRMRSDSAASAMSSLPSEPSISSQNTPQLPYVRASSPDFLPLHAVALPMKQQMLPVAPAQSEPMVPVKSEPVPLAPVVAAPSFVAAAPPSAARQPSAQFDEAQLDDFLEELQLHELTSSGKAEQASLHSVAASLTPDATDLRRDSQPAILSQAALQQLLLTLAGPENGYMAQSQGLAAF